MMPIKDKLAEVIWVKPPQSVKQMREAITEEWREKAKLKRILLADDDALSIDLFHNATQEWNYELVPSYSVRATIARLEGNEPFTAALLDAVLLNGSGLDIYRWVAANRPDLNVAFLTNFDAQHLQEQIQIIGPARVFNKTQLGNAEFVAQLMLQIGIERKQTSQP
jgi:CheY-like chemotaxis protein